MLNHSVHYGLAAAASWVEFILELYFLPEFKRYGHIWLLGVALCTCGEVIRKMAIITAGQSFTHLVSKTQKVFCQLVANMNVNSNRYRTKSIRTTS